MKIISVNRHVIDTNRKQGRNDPPIRVANSKYGKPTYYHEYKFKGGRVVYDPKNPLPCGARLWLELENTP